MNQSRVSVNATAASGKKTAVALNGMGRRMMGGKRDYLKQLPWQSEFDHHYAACMRNHMGWAKMKKANRKWLNKKMRREAHDGQTRWDGALSAWQEFMEVEIDVPEPPRPDMEWHVCGERTDPEERNA